MTEYPILKDKPEFVPTSTNIGQALSVINDLVYPDYRKKMDLLITAANARGATIKTKGLKKHFEKKYYTLLDAQNKMVDAAQDTHQLIIGIKKYIDSLSFEEQTDERIKILLDLYESSMIKDYLKNLGDDTTSCIYKQNIEKAKK